MQVFSRITVFIALLTALVVGAQDRAQWELGTQVPASQGQRTIDLNAQTRWVNVNQDEVIRFVVGSAEFGWRFDGTLLRPFDLQVVAPPGVLSKPVLVYIRPRISLRGV